VGKRGRPKKQRGEGAIELVTRGEKFFVVVSALRNAALMGRKELSYTELLEQTKISTVTLNHVLREGLLKGVFRVRHVGKYSYYWLSEEAVPLSNLVIFQTWWNLGRPRVDDGQGLQGLTTDIWSLFLLENFGKHWLTINREEAPRVFDLLGVPDSTHVTSLRICDLYSLISRRIQIVTSKVERRLSRGEDPMKINQYLLKIEREGWPEDALLRRISALVESGMICKRCFEGKSVKRNIISGERPFISELIEVEDGYICKECKKKQERPENFLLPEFQAWLKSFEEGGKPIKKGLLYIYPPPKSIKM